MHQVSVIIPFYGRPDQLRTCLIALQAQTLLPEDIEILVVDNGSRVDLTALQLQFASVRWLREEGVGSYMSRNRGVQEARHDVIAFTDADCVPKPDWLAEGLCPIREGVATVVGGRIDYIENAARRLNTYERFESLFFLLDKQKQLVESRNVAATANLITTKKTFARVGPFDTQLMNFGDGEWTRRAVRLGERLCYCDSAVVCHPRRDTFQAIHQKVLRVAGDQIIYLRKQGKSCLRVFAEIFRFSPIDPRSHLAIVRLRDTTLIEIAKFWAFGVRMSLAAMMEKTRVFVGGRPRRS